MSREIYFPSTFLRKLLEGVRQQNKSVSQAKGRQWVQEQGTQVRREKGIPRVTAAPQTERATDLDGAGGQGPTGGMPPRGKRK